MRKFLAILGVVALVLALVAAGWLAGSSAESRMRLCARIGICQQPAEVVGTALVSVQRQQQLVVFSARLVTALTAVDRRSILGVPVAEARKTLIVPATVRYALDLASMKPADLSFDTATSTLTVKRPPLLILGPEIDIAQSQEYVDGKLLLALTDSEADLDRINREQATGTFLAQAKQPDLMKMAADSANDALQRSFLIPLRAAGMSDIKVVIKDQ